MVRQVAPNRAALKFRGRFSSRGTFAFTKVFAPQEVDRKHPSVSSMDRYSSFPANGHKSPRKRWKAGVHAHQTTRGWPHAPRPDAHRNQNGRPLPLVLPATASTGRDRCRQSARLLPRRPRPRHRPNTKPHDALVWEERRRERKTRPRRRLLGQISRAPVAAPGFGSPQCTLARNASVRSDNA